MFSVSIPGLKFVDNLSPVEDEGFSRAEGIMVSFLGLSITWSRSISRYQTQTNTWTFPLFGFGHREKEFHTDRTQASRAGTTALVTVLDQWDDRTTTSTIKVSEVTHGCI